MKKLDDFINRIGAFKTFATPSDPLQAHIAASLKTDLLMFLTEIQSDIDELHRCKPNTTKIQLDAKDTLIHIYKDRIDYLEDFIVRLSRETKDL